MRAFTSLAPVVALAGIHALGVLLGGCAPSAPLDSPAPAADRSSAAWAGDSGPLLDQVEERTFHFFWDLAHPRTHLIPDRAPTPSFSSVAAVGFGLTAYPIGAERGYVTPEQARGRVLATLRFLAAAPQGPQRSGVAGHKGFFYHFLDMKTGHRFEQVELSTIDTSLLLAGVLFCQSYYDGDHPEEVEIRAIADRLYRQVDWTWAVTRPPMVSHGWKPESGFLPYDWRGYDESMILYILALGSPTHPIAPEAWTEYTRTYKWGDFQGYEHVAFAPLFGHQYSQVWIDARGIQDAYMREKGIDYFENSRRATYSQRAYATANPQGWQGYGENVWGLTACDGPIDAELPVNGEKRRFYTYAARGAAMNEIRDDGTIAPTAAIASIAFAPEIALPAMEEMHRRWGEHLFSRYGFLDSFNPTFQFTDVKVQHGRVVPGVGWFDGDYLGIDQGPIVAMIENHRSGLVWETMKKNPHIVRGLRRAGFQGGWLDGAPR
jgi:hypothetical protein